MTTAPAGAASSGGGSDHTGRERNGGDICGTGGRAVWQALVDRGILVRDFSDWPGVEDCLRVTVGTPEENAERLKKAGNEAFAAQQYPKAIQCYSEALGN